ncbi:hypothetical protein M0813_02240 [Anaeramoeba flamelloides]|uniref:TRAP transporter small permease n=1 Tax=Anaeramoeba flamelloides TaxID=1746091 RepID=A0AAV7YXY8_9EUKA|nr:hypothetical protein M0812_21718 [Anaeramoeba flamelloides]KAJ6246984.1 hypothetical protein M0813_02240 [Anaeramoeba flamelloides]
MYLSFSNINNKQNLPQLKQLWVRCGTSLVFFFFIIMGLTMGLMETEGTSQRVISALYDAVLVIISVTTAFFCFRLARQLKRSFPLNFNSAPSLFLRKLIRVLNFDGIIMLLIAIFSIYFILTKCFVENTQLAWFSSKFTIWPYFLGNTLEILPTLSMVVLLFGNQIKFSSSHEQNINTHIYSDSSELD